MAGEFSPFQFGKNVLTGILGPEATEQIGSNLDDETFNTIGGLAHGSASIEANEAEPTPTLSEYMTNNPDASYEDIMKYMAQHSEEWAEKYLDYLTERGEIDRANQYTASREDTAYQRLVQDLKNAGLNPAMMYGNSASPSSSSSAGYVRMSEGATSRDRNYSVKLQNLFMSYMTLMLKSVNTITNTAGRGIFSFLKSLF